MLDVSGAIPPFDAVHGVINVGNTTYHELLFETKPCSASTGDAAQRYEHASVKRVQMYKLEEGSDTINTLKSDGLRAMRSAGGSITHLLGSCQNHESELQFSQGMTHVMLVDSPNIGVLRKAMEAEKGATNTMTSPSLVFDFHPHIVKVPEGQSSVGALKHVVLIKFNVDAPVGKLVAGYIELTTKIDEMKGFEWGPFANNFNVDGAGDEAEVQLTNGFEYVFITTFESVADRNTYLFHQAHKDYVDFLVPNIENFAVVDFVAV
uniref:Stress-response A/B barrel domain-containing protein n=1 Tax=Fibrocapsa japonica TaxID=94617 RepID=A0A7S2V429_9STRA